MVLVAISALVTPLRADPPGSLPPYIVTATVGETTYSATTVSLISSGPTGSWYQVTVWTWVVDNPSGQTISMDSNSYMVFDGSGDDHDAQ